MEAISLLAELAIYVALLISTVYAVIFSYHCFSYGSSQTINLIAVITFLLGAGGLVLTMFISLRLF